MNFRCEYDYGLRSPWVGVGVGTGTLIREYPQVAF